MTSQFTMILYLPPGQIRTWETVVFPSSKAFENIAYHSSPHVAWSLPRYHGYSLLS